MSLFRAFCRLAVVITAAGAVLVATPGPAPGCSCGSTPLSVYADRVAVAFTGQQIKRVEPDDVALSNADVALILEVDWVYKGRAGPLISVITNFLDVSCGIDFSGEGQVAVAAFGRDDRLGVGMCSSRHAISDFQAVFGSGYPPDETMTQTLEQMEKSARESIAKTVLSATDDAPAPGRRAPTVALLIGTAAAVLAVGAVVLLRVRRSSEDRRR